MFDTLIAATRDRKRLQEIITRLGRAGLGGFLSHMGLGRTTSQADHDPATTPQRVREALAELGPVYVKLGQILSTRADLLPPEWITELEQLQANVPPLPWEVIAAEIEAALGAPAQEIFAHIDTVPLAAGSIAQVHRARLHEGTQVVVKVRRPGLRPIIDADLRLLSHAATVAEKQSPRIARLRPRELVTHLGAALREELDLSIEGRNTDTIAANLSDFPHIVLPRIHWEYSTDSLLVQDFIDGLPPVQDGRIEAAGLDGPLLAKRGSEAFLQMILMDGMFHADPHPGNLLALSDSRVGLIDFGMVGRVGELRRRQVLTFMAALINARADQLSAVLIEWSGSDGVDITRLEADVDAFIARHSHGLDLSVAITSMMTLARTHHLVLPADLVLLFKAMSTADGVMKRLDPDFDVIASSSPFVRRALKHRLNPLALGKRAQVFALDLLGSVEDLPSLLRLLLHRARKGDIHASVTVNGLEGLTQHIETAALRLGIAVILAAFALGLAPHLMQLGPRLGGIPVFALTGIAALISGVIWLVLSGRNNKR